MMTDLPPVICDYLCRQTLAHRRPGYLHLDRTGKIRAGGGHLADYDLAPLEVGRPVSAVLDFMEGLLPLEDDACHLGCLQPQADVCIDVHIIPDFQDYWLLLLDTREEERQRREMQQKANELALVREAQARQLTRRAAVAAETPAVTFDPAGDRQQIAVLAVGLRLAPGTATDTPPAELLDRLAGFRRKLVAGLHAEAGLVHAQTSDSLTALFGLLPARGAPSEQALSAVIKLLRDFAAAETDCDEPRNGILPPAAGVATGPAVVGLEAGSPDGGVQAVGAPLQAAPQLLQAALPWQVLIDASSFQAAGGLQARFEPLAALRAPQAGPVYAYRRMPKHE